MQYRVIKGVLRISDSWAVGSVGRLLLTPFFMFSLLDYLFIYVL